MYQSMRNGIRQAGSVIAGVMLLGLLLVPFGVSQENTPPSNTSSTSSRHDSRIAVYNLSVAKNNKNFELKNMQIYTSGRDNRQNLREDKEEQNTIEFKGLTTSAVGADHVIHFAVGSTSWSFPISASADLRDFGGDAQAIGANQRVEVEVQVTGTTMTVIEVERGEWKKGGPEAVEQNTIEFKGLTTSAVGADHVIHFVVGSTSWSFPISASADLRDFGGDAQAIRANQRVEVEVQVTGTTMTVIEVEREEQEEDKIQNY